MPRDWFPADLAGTAVLCLASGSGQDRARDMRDLSAFADASFDLVFNPVSNTFFPDLTPVWRECFRVLRCWRGCHADPGAASVPVTPPVTRPALS